MIVFVRTSFALEFGGNVQAAHLRHFNIGEKNIGLMSEHSVQRFRSIARAGDHGDVAFNFKQSGECAQYHPLIFRDHYADGLAPSF